MQYYPPGYAYRPPVNMNMRYQVPMHYYGPPQPGFPPPPPNMYPPHMNMMDRPPFAPVMPGFVMMPPAPAPSPAWYEESGRIDEEQGGRESEAE